MTYQLKGNHKSIKSAINAGKYDYKWGYADHPEDIQGVKIKPVDGKFVIKRFNKWMTNSQVLAELPNLASIMELLQFGIDFPEVQKEFSIATIWKDDSNQLWYVYLNRNGSKRNVNVDQSNADNNWNEPVGFLARENLDSGSLGSLETPSLETLLQNFHKEMIFLTEPNTPKDVVDKYVKLIEKK